MVQITLKIDGMACGILIPDTTTAANETISTISHNLFFTFHFPFHNTGFPVVNILHYADMESQRQC